MKILLVTDSYPPEIRSASHLMLELAQELQQRGHQVTVITTWPEYNLDLGEKKKNFTEYPFVRFELRRKRLWIV